MTPKIETYGPEIDILLFVLVFDLLAYFTYAYVYKRDLKSMATQDIKVSLISLIIISLNYYGTGVDAYLLGDYLNWFWYYLILDTFVSICMMYFYMRYYNLKMKDFE